jgi:soluble lytic murein transglycosylase
LSLTRLIVCFCALILIKPAFALSLYEQRAAYKRALDHLTAGRMEDFANLRDSLSDYPLQPYLDYYALQSRISSAATDTVVGFRSQHADLPVADIIFYRWLRRLGQQRRWETFLNHYEPSTDAELKCYHLRALFGSGGEKEAMDQVADLWLVAKSQPKACDALFDIWIDRGRLTESMVWERLGLALDANSRTLARYLQRFFKTPSVRAWAESYYDVHVTPSSIAQVERFTTDTRYSREVIAHGLTRLAGRDPDAAAGA